jgi:uridine kinase
MSNLTLDEVIEAFSSSPVNRTRIVGIDGPSGSGKSSLARQIVERAGATLVEIDDFVSWSNFSGWWPRFTEQVLDPLLKGADARYQVRDWKNDPLGTSLSGWKIAPWSPLIIVEGVTCTRSAISERLAYRMWMEAPEAVRLERGIARDGPTMRDRWVAWMQEEEEFFQKDGARERADLRIDGAPVEPVPKGVITTL